MYRMHPTSPSALLQLPLPPLASIPHRATICNT